ncbi:FHA domain-containing protein [Nocardioides sp. C4-1]|uniref:FHA domain-containing protein n=1 Tax=Nocardioides sp. C4-1 TaxID=3151851 RepID=UPI0032637301
MTSIRIQAGDRTWTAGPTDGQRVFRIGRDEGADIVVSDPSVSRRHAEIRAFGEGWEVIDVGSSLGTWIDGRRVDRAPLTGSTTVGLGSQGLAFQVFVTVTGAPAVPPPPVVPTAPIQMGGPVAGHPPVNALLDQTIVDGVAFGGLPAPGGPGLLVRRRVGGDLRFPGGMPVRVGRDPSLEVHADDQAVSRLHAVVEPRHDGWWWVDRSTSGTFVDGERVTSYRIDEPTEISLGHPTAGYELEVVPVVAAGQASASIRSRKRRRTIGVVAAAVATLVAATGITFAAIALTGDEKTEPVAGPQGGQGGDTEAERAAALDRAKAAAVLLQAVDSSGNVMWSGSGSVISDTGLILTNAHVGDPNAPGQGSSEEEPDFLAVSLTSGDDDEPATAAYRAEPIVSDGYLDIAVLQIVSDIEGGEVEPDTLADELPAPLPIGDSDELRTGDRIIALGYPAIGNVMAQGDRPLTVTEGVVSTFQADPVVGTERGSIDSDVRLGSGNSGGPSINQAGEIIGLNTRVITASSVDAGSITQGSALIVPVNLAADVLEIARAGGDPDYVSPYLDDLPTDPGLPVDATAVANGWNLADSSTSGSCTGTSSVETPQSLPGVTGGDQVLAEFTLEGVPAGLPISIDVYGTDGTRIDSLQESWQGDERATCIRVPLEVPTGADGLNAVLQLGLDGETAAENPVLFPDAG